MRTLLLLFLVAVASAHATGGPAIIKFDAQGNPSPASSGDVATWIGASAPLWGTITGTLANQTDLQTALNAKGTSNFSGAYADLTGKPVLGTAAATAIIDYATAAQGLLAATALQSAGNGANLTGLTKTQVGLANVENVAISTWAGSANLTTVGTVATGTWNATAIADGKIASALTGKSYAGSTITMTGTITSSGAGVGYATGAGGTVTQATSKSTGVTLNKLCGTITLHNAALAAAATVSFTVTNSTMAATDVVHLQHDTVGAIGSYTVMPNTSAAGSFRVSVRNNSAGSLSEAIVLRFAIVKAVVN